MVRDLEEGDAPRVPSSRMKRLWMALVLLMVACGLVPRGPAPLFIPVNTAPSVSIFLESEGRGLGHYAGWNGIPYWCPGPDCVVPANPAGILFQISDDELDPVDVELELSENGGPFGGLIRRQVQPLAAEQNETLVVKLPAVSPSTNYRVRVRVQDRQGARPELYGSIAASYVVGSDGWSSPAIEFKSAP